METTSEGYLAVRLEAPAGDFAATFCPSLGMIGVSLEHDGEQLLAQRKGLANYAATGSTLGIPLLYPWANRLDGFAFSVGGRTVRLDPDSPLVRCDPNGVPIHGLLAASARWSAVERYADERLARLSAVLNFGAAPDLLGQFPFPHSVAMGVELEPASLTVTTEVRATGEVAVPVSFGYHPYLRLPGAARAEWEIEVPVGRRYVVDSRGIPTGATEPADVPSGRLGERAFDDGFCDLPERPRFTVGGGGRRVAVDFLEGYRFVQVFAPAGKDFICFEPMTAPTNALVSGLELRLVEPGEKFRAAFRISVSR